jgi:putative ABC transport system permease protein
MLSREAMDRTGLIKPGSRTSHRHLFRLDPQRLSIAEARLQLARIYPRTLISDYRETHPQITRGLNRSERFMSLVSLIALIVGAIGVAATMHAHLQQRLDSIAIMKCLGARSSQILRVYLLQTVAVGLAGGLLGCAVGGAVQAAFPILIAKYFAITPRFQWDVVASLEALAVGLLTALLFTWPALLGIRHIRPAIIFRRDMADSGDNWRRRWLTPAPWVAGGLILIALGGIAAYLAGSGDLGETALRTGVFFAGGLVVSLLALAAVAWLLLRSLRLLLRSTRMKLPTVLRHGIANIYRPGNQAQAVLVALGIGVMFTLSVLLIQRGLLAQMLASAPPNMPNVFLLNITSRERDGIDKMLAAQPFLGGKPEIFAVVVARLEAIDGRRLENGNARRFGRPRAVTFRKYVRDQEQIVQGRWWNETLPPGSPNQVCIDQGMAQALAVKPGATLSWSVGTLQLAANVSCVFVSEEVRFDGSTDFVFSPNALGELPVQYFAALRMRPADVAPFQKLSFDRFPSVTVINAAEVIEIIQQVVDQIALVVRFISLFAILAGVIILASSVAATRFRRIKEVAILKTLGASRRRVASIFSIEFLILGAVAGILGSLLASGFSNLLMVQLLDGRARFDPLPNVAAILVTAALAVAAGWLAGHRILGRKPLEVLRHE